MYQGERVPASAAPGHPTTQRSPRGAHGKSASSPAGGAWNLPAEGIAPPAAGNGGGCRGNSSPHTVRGAPTLRSIVKPKL
ncbi:MAG TPA: hypothetical protein VHI13_14480 [Candidatus Kapabacteria bacterium]|nr:hypothetical protein [Candidatus Kapabacteria bacterium]